MRIREKFECMEAAAVAFEGRFSQKSSHYCYERWVKSRGTKYELFWLNMGYLYSLISTRGKA